MSCTSLWMCCRLIVVISVSAIQTHSEAQPWETNRNDLASLLHEESRVDYVLDGIAIRDLGVKGVRCREHRLDGQTYTVGFRQNRIDLVEFSPPFSTRRPNWYQTLCRLFGDHPSRNNWIVDHELTSLFPSVTRSQVTPFMDTKPAKSRTITFNRRTGQVVDVTPWRADSIPTGKVRWSGSTSRTYRCVLRRRDGRAFAIVEGSRYQAQELVPNAVNLVRPFTHRPQEIRRVFVARSNTFFRYLIRASAHELDNAGSASRYEQQIASFIDPADRSQAKTIRLMTTIRYALRSQWIPIRVIASSIQEEDADLVLDELTQRMRLSRKMRRRTLQLVGEIGTRAHLAYCQQFSSKPAFRKEVSAAVSRIAERENKAAEAKRRKRSA